MVGGGETDGHQLVALELVRLLVVDDTFRRRELVTLQSVWGLCLGHTCAPLARELQTAAGVVLLSGQGLLILYTGVCSHSV